jgi:hypothetical protein
MSDELVARLTVVIRVSVIILGGAAVMWGLAVLPIIWRQLPLERTADHITAGEVYKSDTLLGLIPVVELAERAVYCRPAALRSSAIIRARLAEDVLSSGQQELFDKQLNMLHTAIRDSLSCVPADPFLWLVLLWVDNTENGWEDRYLEYLRMSYLLGPNEGWIALRRNRIAFTYYERLTPDLAEAAIVEFVALLESGLYQEAVDILTGPAWDMRELLLSRLLNVPLRHRQDIAKLLSDSGYDLPVPGVAGMSSPIKR